MIRVPFDIEESSSFDPKGLGHRSEQSILGEQKESVPALPILGHIWAPISGKEIPDSVTPRSATSISKPMISLPVLSTPDPYSISDDPEFIVELPELTFPAIVPTSSQSK
jgi:hypothetical protein